MAAKRAAHFVSSSTTDKGVSPGPSLTSSDNEETQAKTSQNVFRQTPCAYKNRRCFVYKAIRREAAQRRQGHSEGDRPSDRVMGLLGWDGERQSLQSRRHVATHPFLSPACESSHHAPKVSQSPRRRAAWSSRQMSPRGARVGAGPPAPTQRWRALTQRLPQSQFTADA